VTAEFTITLAVTSVLILLARFVLPQLPLTRAAVQLTVGDMALLGAGVLGLAFHCTAIWNEKNTAILRQKPQVRTSQDGDLG
jgi:hypothetical protein